MRKPLILFFWTLIASCCLQAQWGARPGLWVFPNASLVQDSSVALALDFRLTYTSHVPDTLFLLMEVPDSEHSNLQLSMRQISADSSVVVIPVEMDGGEIKGGLTLDLERTVSQPARSGRRDPFFHWIALPPGESRTAVIELRMGKPGIGKRSKMRIRFIGTSYTYELDQALEERRLSASPVAGNLHGRRVYAVDVSVKFRNGQAFSAEATTVSKPLEAPPTHSQPLDHIEGLLRDWKGIGNWTISKVGDILVLRHLENGQYFNSMDAGRRNEENVLTWPFPVEVGITLTRHIDKNRLLRQYMNRPNVTHRCQEMQMQAGEYKESPFDTKIPKVQQRMERRYRMFPTHQLDRKHDILVFTFGPHEWLDLVNDHSVTRDYKALMQYLRFNFNTLFRYVDAWYLGNIGKKMLGIPLETKGQ